MKAKMICLVLVTFMQCSSSNKEEQQLFKQAAVIHNEMVAQAELLEEALNVMANDSSLHFYTDSIAMWRKEIETWESDLVEVPGNEEHHHNESEHHHHDHQPLNVTAAQMLTIQKELQSRLQLKEDRIRQIRSSNY